LIINSLAVFFVWHIHELLAVGKRYQFVAWAYLIGLFVPVPFWILHRQWPKLGANYLCIPLMWCIWSLLFIVYTGSDPDVPTMLVAIGALCFGINSYIRSYSCIVFFSKWWLLTQYPRWFVKYNYILAAALDGSIQVQKLYLLPYSSFQTPLFLQVMVFILTFTIFGASCDAHLFPKWFVLFCF
jgi:hypothetical protein